MMTANGRRDLIQRLKVKPVLRNKVLISVTHHPDSLYIREQGCEYPWLFSEARRGPRAKTFGKR